MATTLRGNDILFNDGTTQSTAATGTPTTYGAVGTYVTAFYSLAISGSLAAGTTVAGSTLYRVQDYGSGSGIPVSGIGTASSSDFKLFIITYFGATSLGLTGTWRNLTYLKNNSSTDSMYLLGLFVRVS